MSFKTIETPKKVFGGFDNIFHVYLIEEIEFSWWLFEGRLRQGKNVLPDGLNWLCYFAGNSKSHHENSISFPSSSRHEKHCQIFQTLFWYFNTLETQ